MNRPRLLVLSKSLEQTVRPSRDEFDIVLLDEQGDRDAFLRDHGSGIEVILASGMERLNEARFAMLPDLKLIATVAAGMAGIDLQAAKARGIAVTNAGDLNSADVADFAITLMLAHAREVVANDAWVREDKWPGARRPPARSIASHRVGIVGLGHIGQAIAARLAPFGCEIAWWGPREKPDVPWPRIATLEELAAWASVLIVAARGDNSTRGLVSRRVIEALGPDGLIVNVSRGFVIDEAEMVTALKDGRLGGAALDVFDREPLAGSTWAGVPNVLMAPHVAGATKEAFAAVFAGALENVRRHFAGEPLVRRVV